MLSILFIYFHHYHDFKTLGFIYFVGLKIHRKSLVYAAQCRVPGWTPQNKSGPSKVTPPKTRGYVQKTAPDTPFLPYSLYFHIIYYGIIVMFCLFKYGIRVMSHLFFGIKVLSHLSSKIESHFSSFLIIIESTVKTLLIDFMKLS